MGDPLRGMYFNGQLIGVNGSRLSRNREGFNMTTSGRLETHVPPGYDGTVGDFISWGIPNESPAPLTPPPPVIRGTGNGDSVIVGECAFLRLHQRPPWIGQRAEIVERKEASESAKAGREISEMMNENETDESKRDKATIHLFIDMIAKMSSTFENTNITQWSVQDAILALDRARSENKTLRKNVWKMHVMELENFKNRDKIEKYERDIMNVYNLFRIVSEVKTEFENLTPNQLLYFIVKEANNNFHKMKRAQRELLAMSQPETPEDALYCIICMNMYTKERSMIVIVDCKHTCCEECFPGIIQHERCPTCRGPITNSFKLFH